MLLSFWYDVLRCGGNSHPLFLVRLASVFILFANLGFCLTVLLKVLFSGFRFVTRRAQGSFAYATFSEHSFRLLRMSWGGEDGTLGL